MREDTKVWVMLAIVAAGVLVAASWSHLARRAPSPRAEKLHRALMAVCAAFGIWAFTLFGALHDHGAHGHQIFHAHDCYHYYFGSKYLKEWGYDGMYFATVAALEEVGREEPRKAITFNRIRDLDGSARFLYRADFEPRLAEARARFSPARWAQLKKDLSFLRDITSNNDWWHGVMLDNGFNPPPSFAAITGTVANVIPFDERTWKFLGLIDVALMGAGFAAIAWAFGAVPALFAIVITGNAPITTFNWTGGSFFRQLWLFCLMVGLSMLAKKKWYGAGAALGACTACVFFPIFFVVGAATPLAYKYRVHQARGDVPPWRRELAQFAIGVAAAMAFLLGLSLVVYGRDPWWQWWHRIVAHDLTFFDNHIGLKKITTFAPQVGQQAFGASDFVYPDWNHALVARAQRGHTVELVLSLLLSGWFVVSGLRARAAEACLIVGSALLVIWTMPAGYYTILRRHLRRRDARQSLALGRAALHARRRRPRGRGRHAPLRARPHHAVDPHLGGLDPLHPRHVGHKLARARAASPVDRRAAARREDRGAHGRRVLARHRGHPRLGAGRVVPAVGGRERRPRGRPRRLRRARRRGGPQGRPQGRPRRLPEADGRLRVPRARRRARPEEGREARLRPHAAPSGIRARPGSSSSAPTASTRATSRPP